MGASGEEEVDIDIDWRFLETVYVVGSVVPSVEK